MDESEINDPNQDRFRSVLLHEPMDNLTELLFKNYDKERAPLSDSDLHQKWIYYINVLRFKIIDVDEPKEQVTLVTEIMQQWSDIRLLWDPTSKNNISVLYFRLEKVWSPPVTVFYASELVEHRDQNYRMVSLSPGFLTAYVPMKITTNCKLNLLDFPFDTQICEIRIGIPSIDSSLYDISISDPEELRNNMCGLGNSVWDLINITSGLEPMESFCDCFNDTKLAVVRFQLKRNPTYYLYMIILPTFIINTISISGVFMKNTEKMDRLTVGLTHIMTMTFILGIISDKLPKTEQIPLLGKYIIFGLCTMIVALTFSTYLKKISGYFSEKLRESRSDFSQKLRRFIGSPLRIICIFIFQAINVLSVIYLLYRYAIFENQFGSSEKCTVKPKTMDLSGALS
ncbi:unnamed protein product [Caenorhabditis angaria]|uniref:Neurotransmitter-gated ion-channel ligand-binding domain-containing protein n=1 Tax=Caenorhabditis angaria TaxID=860376 RepID=A0A9P1I8W3_9PELO|nr:unnamed protein product [Caenorhabditis angaria]